VIETPPRAGAPCALRREYDEELVKQAIEREIERKARRSSCTTASRRSTRPRPDPGARADARVLVAHGRWKRSAWRSDDDFLQASRRAVCTSIVESGLDIPNANTSSSTARTAWPAQNVPDRGRVAASRERAYAYSSTLVGAPLRGAQRRLSTLSDYTEWAPASRSRCANLEIRGRQPARRTSSRATLRLSVRALPCRCWTRPFAELAGTAAEEAPEVRLCTSICAS